MDTIRMMLLSLMVGVTASTGTLPEVPGIAPEPIVFEQAGDTAPESASSPIYVTPAPAAPTERPVTEAGFTRDLERGVEGEDVRAVQQRLKDLKYKVSVDGTFGTQTRDAVKAFQRNNGLKADGIVGSKTYTKLMSDSAKAAKSSSSSSSSSSSTRTSLSFGMSGDDVARLQLRLRELDYFLGDATGYFGEATERAVRAFQLANGLSADGIAGTSTLTVVYSANAVRASSGVATPTGTPTSPQGVCSYCLKAIDPLDAYRHQALGNCGRHRLCEAGDHNATLPGCGHYPCDGRYHVLFYCGIHYQCLHNIVEHSNICGVTSMP